MMVLVSLYQWKHDQRRCFLFPSSFDTNENRSHKLHFLYPVPQFLCLASTLVPVVYVCTHILMYKLRSRSIYSVRTMSVTFPTTQWQYVPAGLCQLLTTSGVAVHQSSTAGRFGILDGEISLCSALLCLEESSKRYWMSTHNSQGTGGEMHCLII